jgi:hypothetical protein
MRDMGVHVIANPVPTPEEMGRMLGLSSERVAAVRSIMNSPSGGASSKRSSRSSRVVAAKKSAARTRWRTRGKR